MKTKELPIALRCILIQIELALILARLRMQFNGCERIPYVLVLVDVTRVCPNRNEHNARHS